MNQPQEMFPLHGPYHPAYTTGAATVIDALARYLNYATRHPAALPGPADAYELAGALRVAAAKLPQAFRQMGRQIDRYAQDGDAAGALDEAATLALALAAQLAQVQSALRPLAAEPPLAA